MSPEMSAESDVKHCPNEECPSRRTSSIPEFRDEVEDCPRCGTELEDGPASVSPAEYVELVEVASFMYVHEAELAATHLDAAGVPSAISNRNTLGLHSLLSVALGGVKLMVAAEDLELAREILCQDARPLDVPGTGPYRGGATAEEDGCTRCGSTDIVVARPHGPWMGILGVLLLGIPFLFVPKQTCRTCGARWRAPSRVHRAR
jgi:hypothetical protein